MAVAEQLELDCWRKLKGETIVSTTLDSLESVQSGATGPETEAQGHRSTWTRTATGDVRTDAVRPVIPEILPETTDTTRPEMEQEENQLQQEELDHWLAQRPVPKTPEEPELCTCYWCHSRRVDVPFDSEEAGPTTVDTDAGVSKGVLLRP